MSTEKSSKSSQDIQPMMLTRCERDLVNFIREMQYGEFKVCVQASQPVRIENPLQSIKLG